MNRPIITIYNNKLHYYSHFKKKLFVTRNKIIICVHGFVYEQYYINRVGLSQKKKHEKLYNTMYK